jgi:hypothetical protein
MGTMGVMTLVLAGCGSGSSTSTTAERAGSSPAPAVSSASAADATAAAAYRKKLDAECAKSAAFSRSLPELRKSQNLSMDELLARVKQEGERLRSAIAGTRPPAALAQAHQKLVDDVTKLQAHGSDPISAALLATQTEAATAVLNDYERVGAKVCASNERQSIKFLQAQSRALKATPTPG